MTNLNNIQNPEFLKKMTVKELEQLAGEIRSFLITNISKTGGHLASNLGVVELTIALHYVFDSPTDKIFFDVGHQSYTHKILTGRASRFPQLRQYKGLSGFQKRSESIHDVWEAGHSSTSLSAALGMAIARDLSHADYYVVPVIGDGALSSGMALEALNQIGSEKRNMIIIFNDNNMSISRNVGALTKGFSRLRAGAGYNSLKMNMKRSLRSNTIGEFVYTGLKTMKDALKDTIIDKGVFGEFNVEYLGPIDGHNMHDLIQSMQTAKLHEGPIVLHVITQKGKGYLPCETDREGSWHSVGAFNITTGEALHHIPEGYITWSQLMSDNVLKLADENEDIVALTPAMMKGSALHHFFAKYPERSFDCGIAEEHAATMAAGLAVAGKRPYLTIYSSFLQRAYDQINHDICRMDLPVVIGIDRCGLVGEDGETHHGVFDPGILSGLPNLIIAQPKDADEAGDLLYTAFHQKHPFAVRFPKGTIPAGSREMKEIPIGSWTIHHDAPENKVIVLSYGEDVERILDKVTVNNMPVTVVNCRFLKPLDEQMMRELCARNLPMIAYESDMKINGLGAGILSLCNDCGLDISLTRFAFPDEYIQQGGSNQLRREMHTDLMSLMEKIEELIKK